MSELRANELVIEGNWSPQEGTTVVIAKTLILKANSRVIIDGKVDEFRLICEESQIEENTRIEGRGNGPGDDGVNFEIYFGKTTIDSLTIDTSGSKGKKGAKGSPGRNGPDAHCVDRSGGNGGRGGRGAQGGAGGKGGDITIGIDASSPTPNFLEIIAKGGLGGDGGDGGDGGKGGKGKRCGLWRRGAGYDGPIGASGDPGQDGHDGVVNVHSLKSVDQYMKEIGG